MTDKKDDYYQPWLRDPAPTPGMGAPMRDEGLAKPKDEPPVGIDLTRYSKPEKPRGEPLVTPEAIRAWPSVALISGCDRELVTALRSGGIASSGRPDSSST